METIVTTDTRGADLKVEIAIDMKTAAIVAVALFVAVVGALITYKYLPK